MNWLENTRGCGVASRNARLTAIRSFLSFASENNCALIALSMDVQNSVKAKKHHGKIVEYLSEPALKTLLAQPDTKTKIGLRNMVFMSIMYDTGARCGELLPLRVCDFRIQASTPVVHLLGKGMKTRLVPLLPKTVEHCKKYMKVFHPEHKLNSEDYFFYTVIHGRKNCISADTVAVFMKKYGIMAREICPEIPQKVHPHMIRHTRAMHYYHDGMPLVLLSEYLGHASPKSTAIYAYADTEMKLAAMKKARSNQTDIPEPIAIWENNESMILKLCGLE